MDDEHKLATQKQLVKIQLQAATHGDALIYALTNVLKLNKQQHKDLLFFIEEHISEHPITDEIVDIFVKKL